MLKLADLIDNYVATPEPTNPIKRRAWLRKKYVIPKEKFEHLKFKQFFEFNDIDIEGVWFRVTTGKKGIGKTYQVYETIKNILIHNQKILYFRMTLAEMNNFKEGVNNSKNLPFVFADKKRIKDRKTNSDHGMYNYMSPKALQSLTSLNYSDYKRIIVDEYQPINRQTSPLSNIAPVESFIRTVSDVDRSKEGLIVDLVGNENTSFDPVKQFFGVHHDEYFVIFPNAGVAFFNLLDFYIGCFNDNKKVSALLAFSPELDDIFTNNTNTEVVDFIKQPKNMKYLKWFYLINRSYGKKPFAITGYRDKVIILSDNFINNFNCNANTPMFGEDLTACDIKGCIPLKDSRYMVRQMILLNKMARRQELYYDSPNTKVWFLDFIERYEVRKKGGYEDY